jgi:hypothetical protein
VLLVCSGRDRVERVLALVDTVDPFYRLAALFGR